MLIVLLSLQTIKADCDSYGMPLMVEPLCMSLSADKKKFVWDGNVNRIVPLVRQAVDLGE